jgi:hypothetical protein
MTNRIHTSSSRKAKKLWTLLGGTFAPVHRTGEVRYVHPAFEETIRANDRRNDVPAVLLSRINRLLKLREPSDPVWGEIL